MVDCVGFAVVARVEACLGVQVELLLFQYHGYVRVAWFIFGSGFFERKRQRLYARGVGDRPSWLCF